MPTRFRTRVAATVAASALLLGAAACSSDDDDASDDTTTTTAAADETTETTEASGMDDEGEAAEGNIVEVAVEAGSFTTLAELLTAADLVEALEGDGPFTVFAPTDEAFAAVPADILAALGEDIDALTTVLTYHVVEGEFLASDVVELDGQNIPTLSGQMLTVKVDGESVFLIDGAGQEIEVVDVDVMASNGVIHVLGGVLLPPGLDL